MKFKNKIAAVIMAASMIATSAVSAFATPNEDVIKALKDAKLPETYIIQAENYLKNNEVEADAVEVIKEQIDKADEVMKAAGTKDGSKLNKEEVQEIVKAVKAAGKAIDIDINVKKNADGKVAVVAKDKTGEIVADFSTAEVKKTGINNSILAAGGAMMLMAAVAFVFGKKRISE